MKDYLESTHFSRFCIFSKIIPIIGLFGRELCSWTISEWLPRELLSSCAWGNATWLSWGKLLEWALDLHTLWRWNVSFLLYEDSQEKFLCGLVLKRALTCLSNHLMEKVNCLAGKMSSFSLTAWKPSAKSVGHLGQILEFTTCHKLKFLQQEPCLNYSTVGTTKAPIRMCNCCKPQAAAFINSQAATEWNRQTRVRIEKKSRSIFFFSHLIEIVHDDKWDWHSTSVLGRQ